MSKVKTLNTRDSDIHVEITTKQEQALKKFVNNKYKTIHFIRRVINEHGHWIGDLEPLNDVDKWDLIKILHSKQYRVKRNFEEELNRIVKEANKNYAATPPFCIEASYHRGEKYMAEHIKDLYYNIKKESENEN